PTADPSPGSRGRTRGGSPPRPADPALHRRVGDLRGSDPARHLAAVREIGTAVLDPVHDRAAALLESVLEPSDESFDASKPRVDGLPSRADQVDEQSEVVDACVALADGVGLEPLDASNQ